MLAPLPMNPSATFANPQPSDVSYVGMAGREWNLNVTLRELHANSRKGRAVRPDEIVIG